MRILYVITQGEQGGGQKYVLDLATGMLQKGEEVYVAIGEIENEGDKWLFEKLRVEPGLRRLKDYTDSENLYEIKSLQREIKIFRDIKSVFEFVRLIRKIQPDVMHLNSSKAGVVGAIAGFVFNLTNRKKVKTIYTVHGFVFLEPMNFIKKIIFIFMEWLSACLRDFTILITQKDIEAGKKFGVLWGDKKHKLIYNGVKDLKGNMLSREDARKFIFGKIPPTPFIKGGQVQIVGTISNLYKTKGLEYLIEAANRMFGAGSPLLGRGVGGEGYVFIVLGFGPEEYRQELQDKINNLGLQNSFFLLGKTPDAYKYLKAFDVFTLTSVKEGLPYTLLEAHMAGVPIVATCVGGIPEMAQHIKINLAECKNSQNIAEKILLEVEKISDEVQKQDINTDLPEVYRLENCIQKTLEVYKGTLVL